MLTTGTSPYYPVWSFGPLGVAAVFYTFAQHLWVAFSKRILMRNPLLHNPDFVPISATSKTHNQVAIVTGSNTGIGFETAKALAVDHGMTVVLGCRSRDKAEQAAQTINAAVQNSKVKVGKAIFVHPLDLSSFQSVKEFSRLIKEKFSNIHVLINNAGRNTNGESSQTYLTNKGERKSLDMLFQSNILGHYLLTAELMSAMVKQARIVNLASVMHHYCGGMNVEDIDFWRSCAFYHPLKYVYSASKLAAILFSIELNQRYEDRIQSIVVNPGAVNSDIWRTFPRIIQWAQSILYINNEEGCQTSVAAAISRDLPLSHNKLKQQQCVTYLQPYPVVWSKNKPAFPPYEMLAPFAGPHVAKARLPKDGGTKAAAAFWQACQELTQATWDKSSESQASTSTS